MNNLLYNLLYSIPELILILSALIILLMGSFLRKKFFIQYMDLACFACLAAVLSLFLMPAELRQGSSFSGALLHDAFNTYIKLVLYLASAFSLILSRYYIKRELSDPFEYPVLLLFALTGMSIMISSGSFLTLYMGLELQSLSLYILVAFKRDSERATEAGLKYFVLGALSSGLLLYGISLVYGFTGSIFFDEIITRITDQTSIGLTLGLVFVLSALVFKISAAPFHMWTPDVYEGSPTAVTVFLATASKFAGLAILARVLIGPFGDLLKDWQQILFMLSVLTLFWGAFAALVQKNIKRLMAYSSITNIGYALIALSSASIDGVRGMLVFSSIYLVSVIGVFAVILAMRRKDGMVENIEDLAGLAKTKPFMCVSLTILLFSMIGMPPFAGFFAKIYALMPAIKAGFVPLVILALIASAISAFYYLKLIRIMWFDAPSIGFVKTDFSLRLVMVLTVSLISLLFIASFLTYPIGNWIKMASQALF